MMSERLLEEACRRLRIIKVPHEKFRYGFQLWRTETLDGQVEGWVLVGEFPNREKAKNTMDAEAARIADQLTLLAELKREQCIGVPQLTRIR